MTLGAGLGRPERSEPLLHTDRNRLVRTGSSLHANRHRANRRWAAGLSPAAGRRAAMFEMHHQSRA
jgi:hypothetical protein